MASNQRLMSEEEVLAYFIQNNGTVRNNDIVTYFRNYLANPAIRDEARALFKTIVNKLAQVKVEQGEKFLVLKKQYFSLIPLQDKFEREQELGYNSSPPQMSNFTPYPYQAPPPYISSGAFPQFQPLQNPALNYSNQNQTPPQMSQNYPMNQTPTQNYSQNQKMAQNQSFADTQNYHVPKNHPSQSSLSSSFQNQSQHYGSHYSLNSNYSGGRNGNNLALDDYGLPPAPIQNKTPPRRLSFSSPPTNLNINNFSSPPPPPLNLNHFNQPLPPNLNNFNNQPLNGNGVNSQQTNLNLINSPPRMVPPPYRPPPPAPFVTSPTSPISNNILRQSPPGSMRPKLNLNLQDVSRGKIEPFPAFPFQRSLSVSSGLGVSSPPPISNTGAQSASVYSDSPPFFPGQSGSPAPPVPPRAKRSASFISPSSSNMDIEEPEQLVASGNGDKENIGPKEDEKISVRERMQKFNKIATVTDLNPKLPNGHSRSRRDNGSKHDSGDYDTSSLSSFGYVAEPLAREWILKAAKLDYSGVNKMASETPSLAKRKDINTALHWAAKFGHVELIKLLAGTFNSDVNAKSNGGYTPLHLAAQFSRQEAYDILVKTYNADPNTRDHSGKKAMQYLVRQDTSVSIDTVKKLKEKRRSTESNRESFLRIGSLNVRVKKTTEAFGNFLGKSSSASNIERVLNKKWGSSDSLPDVDTNGKELMPPPSGPNVPKSHSSSGTYLSVNHKNGKRGSKSKKVPLQNSAPVSPSTSYKSSDRTSAIMEDSNSGSDSDTACGFGSGWKNPQTS